MSSSSTRPSSGRQPPAHIRRLSSSTVRASVSQRTTSSASTCPEGRLRQRGDRLRELTSPRLLHIKGSSPFGGDCVLMLELGRAAQERGFEVDVLAIDPHFQASIRGAGLGLVDLDVIRREIRPVWDARGLMRLRRSSRDPGTRSCTLTRRSRALSARSQHDSAVFHQSCTRFTSFLSTKRQGGPPRRRT